MEHLSRIKNFFGDRSAPGEVKRPLTLLETNVRIVADLHKDPIREVSPLIREANLRDWAKKFLLLYSQSSDEVKQAACSQFFKLRGMQVVHAVTAFYEVCQDDSSLRLANDVCGQLAREYQKHRHLDDLDPEAWGSLFRSTLKGSKIPIEIKQLFLEA